MSYSDLVGTWGRNQAASEASSHVYRQQHDGSTPKGRYDAMVWRDKYAKHGRCKCKKCVRAWGQGDPSERSSS